MIHNREFRIGQVTKIGDRLLLVITHQTMFHWDEGCIGRCTPVALVLVEGDRCTVWQLDEGLPRGKLQCVLAGMAEPRSPGLSGP